LASDDGELQQQLDFNKYLGGLYGYAMVLSRNRAEAEDLVQETCMRALRGIDGLRDQSNTRGWLFTILRNVWLNQLRQGRTRPDMVQISSNESGTNGPADAMQDPHAKYVTKMEREQVRVAIQNLSVEHREIIMLREYEELSYEEIAGVLGCPPGTVMSRLARARVKIREAFASTLGSSPGNRRHGKTNGTAA
jgi:RNA polymerase sigma-70 factor, ECF subfamily